MKNHKGTLLWSAALGMSLFVAATVWASDRLNRGGNGSEIPTPFSTMNQYAELADGEEYVLVGTVQLKPTYSTFGQSYRAYFKVDLDEHPWLANAKRRLKPYYPLLGSSSFWKDYDNKRVRIPVVAHGVVTSIHNGVADYEIELSYESAGRTSEPLPIETCFRETGSCF